ncbi:MAG: hypothetical protein M3P18_18810, partial [Actinomycetota bacterium]|nr:hypothetical protein [Actinomycetota bacterium]
IERIDEAILHLDGRLRLIELFQKMRYYQSSLAIYRSKHPELASKQMSLRRPALSRNWKILLRQPKLTLGIALLKTAEVTGYIWGAAIRGHRTDRVMANENE